MTDVARLGCGNGRARRLAAVTRGCGRLDRHSGNQQPSENRQNLLSHVGSGLRREPGRISVSVIRHFTECGGGLRRSLSSGRALRGPVGLTHPTSYGFNSLTPDIPESSSAILETAR